jgi:hypothetical protein
LVIVSDINVIRIATKYMHIILAYFNETHLN